MKTPICDFLKKYSFNRAIRLHMPGHKGQNGNSSDITEVFGGDSLFDANGIIYQSEDNASSLFESNFTCYSTEGSSLSIKTMVYAICQASLKKGESPLILATRNAHQSFIYALGLCNCSVEWLYGKGNNLSVEISGEILEEKINSMERLPTAIYITSPDYLGGISPIGEISRIAKKYGIILAVDNAHGSYLKFLDKDIHPLSMGADMCVDSAHKTLPVLTGGGYLHIGKNFNIFTKKDIKSFMKIFASTSPSYLILQSLDNANKYIYENKQKFLDCENRVKTLKNRLIGAHFTLFGNEEFKISINAKRYGYLGTEIASYLRANNIEVEFCDKDYVTLMFSTHTKLKEFKAVEQALLALEKREEIKEEIPILTMPKKVMDIRKALFSENVLVKVKDSLGLVLANGSVSCPPAVCPVVIGEEIDENVIKVLTYYGIENVYVVKK